jgi:hypothetical protein
MSEKIVSQYSEQMLKVLTEPNTDKSVLMPLTVSSLKKLNKIQTRSSQKDIIQDIKVSSQQSIVDFLDDYKLLSCKPYNQSSKPCVKLSKLFKEALLDKKIQLRNLDLSDNELEDIDLSGSDLSGANLKNTNLPTSITKQQLQSACSWSDAKNFWEIATVPKSRLIKSDDNSTQNKSCQK